MMIDGNGPKFVFNDCDPLSIQRVQKAIQQGSFTRTQEAGNDSDGNAMIDVISGFFVHVLLAYAHNA